MTRTRPSVPLKLSLLSLGGVWLSVVSPQLRAETVQGYVMEVQLTPAACLMDSLRSKKRKCLEGYSLNIQGLFPETSKRDCHTTSSAALSPLQAKVVARVMPDEGARVQLWKSVGGCVPGNASQYFRTIINFAERLKVPAELTSPETRQMQLNTVRLKFLQLNPGLTSAGIHFTCQNHQGNPLLTGVQLCYRTNGQYRQCSGTVTGNCPATVLIKGSY
ncbi:ribonuclease I [Acinetobacter sp. WCHAc010052]|uniref:ribonuclease T2 family protein n=1 Tax=Acinetobacter sp. WCHAc010052 TaxID=2004647 RepID=UPI000B3C5CC1|nr:ribonuclease I [Acinetobacter sp. WCHAc010052]AXY59105.1 ribonuclease I [Acinetobacter sp. WCHAc010052]